MRSDELGSVSTKPATVPLREVEILSRVGGDCTVGIQQVEHGYWYLSLAFEKGERYCLGTARGERKLWRDVTNAIQFVQKNCHYASNVFVEFGTWRLERVNA